MTSPTNTALGALSVAPSSGATRRATGASDSGSWFEAIAEAWGRTLDSQAQRITDMSATISDGEDKPSQVAQLTAESLRFSFLSNSESSSVDSIGRALETMARKQ